MTITPTTTSGTNQLTNATETISIVTSTAPFVYQLFNKVTKALVGPVKYMVKGSTGTVGGIIACDTYANLQTEAATVGLGGTLSADPTPKA